MDKWTRRKFFLTSLAGGAIAGTGKLFGANRAYADNGMTPAPSPAAGKRPVIISSANGLHALHAGMKVLQDGGDTLDAVVSAVTLVENDPKDTSVGYGGLPNEDCEVELDACVMHGPTMRAGSVGAVRRIKNPAKLAKIIMERTNHIMLVGEGARQFAVDEGFQEEDLLTDESRRQWLAWKASTSFNWRPGIDSPEWKPEARLRQHLAPMFGDSQEEQMLLAKSIEDILHPPTGTIPCMAVDAKGDISATTTTSGLAWKIRGRVGDSPIIGAGCCVDNEVGAAGSTGKGEENIKICGGHTIVEMMRRGMSPTDACMEALQRIAHNYKNDKTKLKTFHIFFYALNKDGVHGAAALWNNLYDKRPASYAVNDGGETRLERCKALFDQTVLED